MASMKGCMPSMPKAQVVAAWSLVSAVALVQAFFLGDLLVAGIFVDDIALATNRSKTDAMFSFGISFAMFYASPLLFLVYFWLMGMKAVDSSKKGENAPMLGSRSASTRSTRSIASASYRTVIGSPYSASSAPTASELTVWLFAWACWVSGRVATLFTYTNYDQFTGVNAALTAFGGGMLYWMSSSKYIPVLRAACGTTKWGVAFVNSAPAIYVVLFPVYADRTILGASPLPGAYWYENERNVSVFGVIIVTLLLVLINVIPSVSATDSKVEEKGATMEISWQRMLLFFTAAIGFMSAFYVPYAELPSQIQSRLHLNSTVDGSNLVIVYLGIGSATSRLVVAFLVWVCLKCYSEEKRKTKEAQIEWIMLYLMSIAFTVILFCWEVVKDEQGYYVWGAMYGIVSGALSFLFFECAISIGFRSKTTAGPEDERLQTINQAINGYGFSLFLGALLSAILIGKAYTTVDYTTAAHHAGGAAAGSLGLLLLIPVFAVMGW